IPCRMSRRRKWRSSSPTVSGSAASWCMAATNRPQVWRRSLDLLQPSLPFEPNLVFVRQLRAKRYVIRVADDGTVRVTIPRWGSRREAAAFAEQEQGWIEKQQRRAERDSHRPSPPALPPEIEHELRARARRELPARLFELAAGHGLLVA